MYNRPNILSISGFWKQYVWESGFFSPFSEIFFRPRLSRHQKSLSIPFKKSLNKSTVQMESEWNGRWKSVHSLLFLLVFFCSVQLKNFCKILQGFLFWRSGFCDFQVHELLLFFFFFFYNVMISDTGLMCFYYV